ncbi:hypothetical protein IWW47_002048, partial [Coemansia sp. RSA 2052]
MPDLSKFLVEVLLVASNGYEVYEFEYNNMVMNMNKDDLKNYINSGLPEDVKSELGDFAMINTNNLDTFDEHSPFSGAKIGELKIEDG